MATSEPAIISRERQTRTFYDPDFGAYVLCQENALGQEAQSRYYGAGGGNVAELRYCAGVCPDFRFTGQREDATIGLYFYNARYYDPVLGRFIQPDTIVPEPGNPASLNRYSYVNNSPLTYIDNDGHFAFVPLLIAGAVGAVVTGGLDLGKQLIVDQKSLSDVNWAEVGGSAAGGFVAGATLGLAPAGVGLVSLALLGGVGSAAGSQVQAITQGGLEELMGENPQKSILAEARNLGLFDTSTILYNAGAGMIMGGVGGKFASILRSKLSIPSSVSSIRNSGELPMVRWQMSPGQPGTWTIAMEGRVIQMDANTFEKFVRAMAIGGYELVEDALIEGIQQGLVWILEENSQP